MLQSVTTDFYVLTHFYGMLWCFPHSWYLAADMQFYLISPLVLIPLSYKNKVRLLGYFFIGALILIHMATTAFFSWDFLAIAQDYDSYISYLLIMLNTLTGQSLFLRQACLRRRLTRKTSMVARCIEISLNLFTGIKSRFYDLIELVTFFDFGEQFLIFSNLEGPYTSKKLNLKREKNNLKFNPFKNTI
ncbi:hypothetical protein BpHYR1_017502 [Brachionus plicatilis]|uniref:Nose resistant to fluoxetine 6-like n=1 Tax=Brachionus plicatilis TaxID=10195 RepID=A0A3M7PI50_BRAPC|nr:hypothetical protein BpHYR1_017502 [Brachionus plicatilis]